MTTLEHSAALVLLREATAIPNAQFRDGQWEAIDALVNRRAQLLVVERTGWGKSSVYFIATRILRDRGGGLTLIVSPLLALMRNQIDAAGRLGIKALTINSTNTDEWPTYHAAIENNEVDALLISPERLANDQFVEEVLVPMVSSVGMLVVDEAHCISDWGHDFRPDYRRLVNVLKRLPKGLPVLATTATANNRVVNDVVSQLGDIEVQRGSLMRETLRLATLKLPDQATRLSWLAEHVPGLPGTGIIYVLTKRDAVQVAAWLNDNDIDAAPYFSGVRGEGFENSDAYRQHLENRLLRNDIKALVATTALGMGYDKPDLGFVVHYQAPGSIVAYYQQVGRAGRAIDEAFGILMSGAEDDDIHDYFRRSAFPSEENVQLILYTLAQVDEMSVRELESSVNLRKGQIEHVLKYLSVENPAPVIKQGSKWARTPARFTMDQEQIDRLTQQREVEWQEVLDYVDCPTCLMRHLAENLDDELAEDCGLCSVCAGEPIIPEEVNMEMLRSAQRCVRASEFPLECRRQAAPEAFRIYGFLYGFRGNLPQELRAETGRVLSQWNDAGWGHLVADGKHAGRLGDELVDAIVEMIEERWKPEPAPKWVTCVPSLRHPELVPVFARQIATSMGLPFVEAVRKIRQNEAQKGQENRYHQCANLDGAFEIVEGIPETPVLLLDDIVDSHWTLTVVSALLLQSGSGPVWPVALAAAGSGD
jgi:ATP-dependent DNA helicase RecQ